MSVRVRFEYSILNFEGPSLGVIRQEIAKMGQSGWENYAVDMGRLWFFFKRPADPLADFEHVPQQPAVKPVVPVVAPPPAVVPLLNRNKQYQNGAARR
jgi:hypothetical protein